MCLCCFSSWLAACGLCRYLQVLLESAEFQKSIVFIQGSPLITKVRQWVQGCTCLQDRCAHALVSYMCSKCKGGILAVPPCESLNQYLCRLASRPRLEDELVWVCMNSPHMSCLLNRT